MRRSSPRVFGRLPEWLRRWPADPWERALRLALVVAGVALLAVLLSPGAPDRSRPLPLVERDRSMEPGRTVAHPAPATGTAGYQRWPVAGAENLLMIPAAGPDGHVWVGEAGTNTLALFHPTPGVTVAFPYASEPPARTMGIVVDAANRAWLAQEGRHAIGRFDLERRRYDEFPTPTANSSPFGIALDAAGQVWFTEVLGHRLGRFNPASETFTEYPLPGEHVHPYWLAAGADGRIWFTTITTPLIGVLEPASGRVALLPVPGLTANDATTGITVDGAGTVWFGIRDGGLGRLDPATLAITVVPSPEHEVYGVAADGHGRIWLATTHDLVYVFDPGPRTFCAVRTGPGAWWLTAAADGAIWVVESVRGANLLGRIEVERVTAACN